MKKKVTGVGKQKKPATPTKTELPLDPDWTKPGGQNSFFEDVWEVASQIPRGRVTSYGAIAAYLGARSSARMVGWAMNGSHARAGFPVPAHRVVNRVGLLTGRGHFSPPEKMQQLLEQEGVQVEDHQVVDFQKVFWDPSIELVL